MIIKSSFSWYTLINIYKFETLNPVIFRTLKCTNNKGGFIKIFLTTFTVSYCIFTYKIIHFFPKITPILIDSGGLRNEFLQMIIETFIICSLPDKETFLGLQWNSIETRNQETELAMLGIEEKIKQNVSLGFNFLLNNIYDIMV